MSSVLPQDDLKNAQILTVEPLRAFQTVVVDPPWRYSSRQTDKTHRARCPYPTMTQEELIALPISQWADDNAHLYVWTTNAFIVQAHELVSAWGFKQKTILTWIKPQIGLGDYYRNNTEHCLFAVRGKLKCLRSNARTAFEANRTKHSEKPDEFYELVESMSPGPYLDVFARKYREGWAVWGDEVESSI